MREDKRKEHRAERSSGVQNVDFMQLMGDVDDISLKEELETCNYFLVDSEKVNGRRRVYNFGMDTLDPNSLLEKLNVVFESLECTAKVNIAFGFVLET